MAVIIGANYEAPSAYAFMNNSMMQWFPEAKYKEITDKQSINGYEYYTNRSKFWAKMLTDAKDGEALKGDFSTPYTYVSPDNIEPINNLLKNRDAWVALNDIQNHGAKGHILGFDTETIGDFDTTILDEDLLLKDEFKKRTRARQVAGITEIAFAPEAFGSNARKTFDPKGSFVFGIDSEQRAWLEELLEKKIRGVEPLNSMENSALERMSRYSTIEHNGNAFRTYTKKWKGIEYVMSDSLNISNPNSIEDIKSGIEELSRLYTSDRETRISNVINHIKNFANEKNHVVVGQNLQFDINVVKQYGLLHGTSVFDDDFKYADTRFALAAYAHDTNQTTIDILRKYNESITNKGGGLEAITEAITDSSLYAELDAHNAYKDSVATNQVFKNKELNITERAMKLIDKDKQPVQVSLQDSLIKINSKANIRYNDFLVIDNQITTQYSPSNQYWKFSGYGRTNFDGLTITVDGKEKELKHTRNKFVARFETLNGDNANLFKVFNNENEFANWITHNTSFVGMKDADIAGQTAIHDKDIARRVIDGFFDVRQVSKSSEGDIGGFASLKKYYQAYSDLSSMSEDTIKSLALKDINGNEITTAKQLISNINVGENVDSIIKYAYDNNLDSIQNIFSVKKTMPDLNTHQLGIFHYNERIFMQEAFNVFENNSEFFSEAIQNIDALNTDNNLQKTILLQQMQQSYLSMPTTTIGSNRIYTISDLNSVSIRTGKDTFANLDVTAINTSSSKLQNMFKHKGDSDIVVSNRLFNAVDDLVDRGLLTKKNQNDLLKVHGSGRNSYALANSIVTQLNANTQDIRDKGLGFYISAQEEIRNLQGDLSSLTGKKYQRYSIIANKNHRTLSESSTSIMSLTSGTVTDDFRKAIASHIANMGNMSIIATSVDNSNEAVQGLVRNTLLGMNYDKASIDDFMGIFYGNGKRKANLGRINKELAKQGKEEVRFAFYKSGRNEGSAFALFTTKQDYASLMNELANLDNNASSRDVKNAISGLASYFEIPYLEVHDIGINSASDKIIESVTGHQARSVLVKRADGNLRYDVPSLNLWIDRETGKFRGNIRDQGGSFLTSIRQRFEGAIHSISDRNYTSGDRSFNNPNTLRLKDAASPQMGGAFDASGNLRKLHMFTQKDIDFAFMMNLDPGKDDMGLFKLMEQFATDDISSHSHGGEATRAIRELYDAFNNEYHYVYPRKNGPAPQNLKNVERVFESEQFSTFYQQNLTGQSGGIKSEAVIARYIAQMEHEGKNSALIKFQNDGLIQIMQKAIKENDLSGEDLIKTIDAIANSGLNSVGTEAMMHHSHVFWGNYSIGENTNSRLSGLYRPTYAQQSNYRAFNLSGMYFDNPTELESSLGIHFGDIYTSKSFVDRMRKLESGGVPLTSENITRRSIIGAVASISDAEIQANREMVSKNISNIAKSKGLDETIFGKVYEKMIENINTYEGKFYMRPSLANQNFFSIGDTKNVVSPELLAINELGTKEEYNATKQALSDLVGKSVNSGDVIGYKLNSKEEMVPIFYNGQTIDYFSQENADQLLQEGKTQVVVTRQLEDGKLMIGQEKGTFETMTYYNSVKPAEQAEEIKAFMKELNFDDTMISQDMSENIKTLNLYTDTAYDVIAPINGSRHKVTVLMNNNINKHITDMPFDTKWNLIASEFHGSEKGFENLRAIANEVKYSNGRQGETLGQHLFYDKIGGEIVFDNPLDKGSINALDDLIARLRKSDLQEAKNAVREIDAFSKGGNFAFQSIQRQQMNTFQGQAFRMDQRVYQTLVTQGGGFEKVNGQLVPVKNYTKGNGAKLAEQIRSSITNGTYDRSITGIMMNKSNGNEIQRFTNIDSVWSDIVRSRRGILSPKNETEMYLGILESLEYRNNKEFIKGKNILRIKMEDILENIPASGTNFEGYKNFIFKTDGEFSRFIKSQSYINGNNVNLNANSNSFYVDFGRSVKYGEGEITGILLPFQHINTSNDNLFLGESTKETIAFFNAYNNVIKTNPNGPIDLTEKLDDLYRAYAREIDTKDKKSLASKVMFKMNMPNSSGALALDTIVPVVKMDNDKFARINVLESSLMNDINNAGLQDIVQSNINKLNDLYKERQELISEQAKSIRNVATISNKNKKIEFENKRAELEKVLNLTGKKEYKKYIIGQKGNIESAIVVGRKMFTDTEMDLGHIGHQIFTDYYTGKEGITLYDKYSKTKGRFFKIFDDKNKIPTEEFNEFIENFFSRFEGTNHQEWARDTMWRIDRIMTKENKISYAAQELNRSIDKYIGELGAVTRMPGQNDIIDSLDNELTKQYKREFLTKINEGFEEIGAKYAREVGVLGMTNRYPNFSPTGLLPVRIFLDDNIKGSSVRFIGPQFSILQNLDFDGDNEFIKFLGNGGLIAQDASKEVVHNMSKHEKELLKEYRLMQRQFEHMNQFNLEAYAQSIEDSIKAYRIGDDIAFKSTLLKNLDEDLYKDLTKQFESSLTQEQKQWFGDLEKSTREFIIDHSKLMTEAYRGFDERLGASFTNANMIRAAIQARKAKEYIGNFSKPNLEIRNTMTYMLSLAEGDAEQKLIRINDLLTSFSNPEITFDGGTTVLGTKGVESSGLLTLLEQKGIDTKHVHDANKLNTSTSWREGVRKLFINANGAENIDTKARISALDKLVEGSRKVLFSESTQTNADIVKDILNTDLDTLLSQVKNFEVKEIADNGVLGKIYLRGLYDMSLMDNAYNGFVSAFRSTTGKNPNFERMLSALSDDDISILVNRHGYDFDAIASSFTYHALKQGQTDDVLKVFNRALRVGDVLAYQTENGPVGYIYNGVTKDQITDRFIARFDDYDFATGKKSGKYKFVEGISIKDLNENIKRNPRGQLKDHYLLDYSQIDNPNKNINRRDIDNLSESAQKELIRAHAAEVSVADKLNKLFELRDDADFSKYFAENTSGGMTIRKYNNLSINNTIGSIVGTDANAFIKKANQIEEYLQYGINNKYITGSEDAKSLIRQINKQIAEHPRESIQRFQGDTPFDLLHNYLGSDDYFAGDQLWLRRGIQNIKVSNQIDEAIKQRIETRNANLDLYAKNFYDTVQNDVSLEQSAFKTAVESVNKETQATVADIFASINTSSNPNTEMMRVFNWDNLPVSKNQDFLLATPSATIIKDGTTSLNPELLRAKVGYGKYIGTELGDILESQRRYILDTELTDDFIGTLTQGSTEYYAAKNTRTILQSYKATNGLANELDFTSADTLRNTYKAIHQEDEEIKRLAREAAQEAFEQATKENRENLSKKTLVGNIGESIRNMTPETKKLLKTGGLIVGGTAAVGLVGHALFNHDSENDNVEVPKSVEQSAEKIGRIPKLKHKSDLDYDGSSSNAKQTSGMQRKLAPPSIKPRRNIYHDAKSGFNFKVSAQSAQKLQAESYGKISGKVGISNTTLNVNRDNSKITDNWLANKFAELTE